MATPDERCVNTIRVLSADMVQKANSGHPGAPMGMAPFAHMLWNYHLNFSAAEPKWANRDRFVLSNGHACAMLYSLLHLTGHKDFPISELQRFRQLHSKTPGHPENYLVDGGIEVTTGPLGQGVSNAVGLAIGERHMAATYNRPDHAIFDHYTFAFVGDGCLQEGVSSEACSLAGHLGLNRLIVLYDDNTITIDGHTNLSFTEDVGKRYEAYGWHVLTVDNGNADYAAIDAAIKQAKTHTDKPTLIKIRTTIGWGSSKANTHGVHGSPLGAEELKKVKAFFGFDPEQSFVVPDDVQQVYRESQAKVAQKVSAWKQLFESYRAAHPTEAAEVERRLKGELPKDWRQALPVYKPGDAAKATRQYSQTVINALAKAVPELFGGSADLNPSTLSYMECSGDFQRDTPQGRNVRFGIREHGMAAICNGLACYGTFIPYAATFLNFFSYALGATRLAAVSKLRVVYVMTHDSIGLGEDGPTHQPIETLAIARHTPNTNVLRPADGNETAGAYAVALEKRFAPTVIALSRQPVPNLANTSIDGVAKGAYVIVDVDQPQLILVGSGSETHVCVNAAKELASELRVRVVSFPSWELFGEQSDEYRHSVFPNGVPVLAVEAAAALGWAEYSHAVVGMRTFGASGPLQEVLDYFGYNTANVVKRARQTVEFYAGKHVPSLLDRPFFDSHEGSQYVTH